MVDVGVDVGIEAVFGGPARIQLVSGCFSTKRILTSDLPLLKPYFQGTTTRTGAPFWFGSMSP